MNLSAQPVAYCPDLSFGRAFFSSPGNPYPLRPCRIPGELAEPTSTGLAMHPKTVIDRSVHLT